MLNNSWLVKAVKKMVLAPKLNMLGAYKKYIERRTSKFISGSNSTTIQCSLLELQGLVIYKPIIENGSGAIV